MRITSICKFSMILGLSATLAACVETTASQAPAATPVKAASMGAAMSTVSRNARAFGGKAQRVGNQATVVTYSGSPRGFFTCTKGSSKTDLAKGMAVDTRTTIVAKGNTLRAETLYIATARAKAKNGKRINTSTAFSNAQSGRLPGGIVCRSTGKLEQSLLSQR